MHFIFSGALVATNFAGDASVHLLPNKRCATSSSSTTFYDFSCTLDRMSRKRRNTSSPELDYSPPPKKSRSMVSYDDEDEEFDHPQDSKEQPRLNPTSGLQNVFPGLGEDGDELFYGPAADGLEYLRMVR